jgi:hypothetical protein
MIVDIIVSILFFLLVGYLILNLYLGSRTIEWEWEFLRWLNRPFCNHKTGYEYMARGYLDTKRTIYSIRCFDCHKDIKWIGIEDKDNTILDSNVDFKWKLLSKEDFYFVLKDAVEIGDDRIKEIKKRQKNVIKG